MTLTKKSYKTTVILDSRDQEKSAEELFKDVKAAMESIGAENITENDLGRRDFARFTNPKFTAGNYYELKHSAPATFGADVQEKFSMDKTVDRIIVQNT